MNGETVRPRFKRKTYLVSKRFQLKYVGQILLLMFLTAALCSYVIYYTTMMMMGEKLANVYPQGRLISIVKLVNLRIFVSILLVSPLVVMIGIFLSHRIAGPIFRIERFLENMAAGDFSARLVLRQKDELKSLAEGINGVNESIRVNVVSQRDRMNKLTAELEKVKKAASSSPQAGSGMSDSIEKLGAEIRALSNELEKYVV